VNPAKNGTFGALFHDDVVSPDFAMMSVDISCAAVSNDKIRGISDWPDHWHPQGYTEAKDDGIEQAYTSQVNIPRRISSQPAHPL